MKDRIRLWVKALRSGKYHQAQRSLRNGNRYCCLGVACDVYHRETGEGDWSECTTGSSGIYGFNIPNGGSSVNSLPNAVARWFGISTNPIIGKQPNNPLQWMSAIRANDDYNLTFDEIADALEREYLNK